jgi:CobQ-like glutamine amidotransferase family enzyme
MKIEMLYPEIANIFGDAMNAEYLRRAVPETQVVKTSLKAEPVFVSEDIDLLYLGSMTESSQALAAEALLPYRDALDARIKSGAILFTGNASELLGERIISEDGNGIDEIKTLGLLDFYAKRMRPKRYNASYLGTFGETKIVGFNSRFSHTYGGDDIPALFETTRGIGRNPETMREGFRVNNLMATYLLGPILITNPQFTKQLLAILGYPQTELPYEKAAVASYEQRLAEFSDPKRGFVYS